MWESSESQMTIRRLTRIWLRALSSALFVSAKALLREVLLSHELRDKVEDVKDNQEIHRRESNQYGGWNPLRPGYSQDQKHVGAGNRNHGAPKPPLLKQLPRHNDYSPQHSRH